MLSKFISSGVAILALSQLATAQTYTDCNPMEEGEFLYPLFPRKFWNH